jgi:hypothetical protein
VAGFWYSACTGAAGPAAAAGPPAPLAAHGQGAGAGAGGAATTGRVRAALADAATSGATRVRVRAWVDSSTVAVRVTPSSSSCRTWEGASAPLEGPGGVACKGEAGAEPAWQAHEGALEVGRRRLPEKQGPAELFVPSPAPLTRHTHPPISAQTSSALYGPITTREPGFR